MNAWLGPVALSLAERRPSLGSFHRPVQGLFKPFPIRLPMKPAASLGFTHPAQVPARRMGQESSLTSPSIGASFLMIAGGAAGLYFSVVVPSPADSIMKGVGIASMAWGGYSLFSRFFGSSTTQVDNKVNAEAPPSKTMSPEAFAKVSAQIIFPLSDTLPKIESDWLSPWDYFNIKVVWRNDSDEVANFKYNIFAESCCAAGLYSPGQTSVQKLIDDSQVAGLQPHTESGAIPLKVDLFQPPPKGKAQPTYKIYLHLNKIGPSGPVQASDTSIFGPFDYK